MHRLCLRCGLLAQPRGCLRECGRLETETAFLKPSNFRYTHLGALPRYRPTAGKLEELPHGRGNPPREGGLPQASGTA
ncbi:unnamed protein product [Coccothraustes coccothraustes]